MPTLIMWQNRFSENENEAVEAYIPQHQDSKTKKPRHRDSETKKLWHRNSGTETPRNKETEKNKPLHRDSKALFQSTKSHEIKIPRLKNHYIEISRPKVGTSGSCGILTIMPTDTCWTYSARTMIQMNLIKFPINMIWVIIFLIFNHIIKRLQHFVVNKLLFITWFKYTQNIYTFS